MQKKLATRVYTWGAGDAGQLGVETENASAPAPIELPFFSDKNITSIVCGGMHSLALSEDGTLFSWGCNDEGVLGREGNEEEPEKVNFPEKIKIKKVVAGDSISAAVDQNGSLWTWGLFRGPGGVIGHAKRRNETVKMQRTPEIVPRIKVRTLAAGCNHLAVVDTRGRLFTWGDGATGALGRYISKRKGVEEGLIPRVALTGVSDVVAGAYHTMAVKEEESTRIKRRKVSTDGEREETCLITFSGVNNFGQAPGASPTGKWAPWREDKNLKTFRKGMGGEHSTHVLDTRGRLWAVGRNTFGQLGVGDDKNRQEFTKCRIENVADFAITAAHALAIADGKLFSWGFGEEEQLGYEAQKQMDPREVALPSGEVPISVGAGGQHSAVVTACHEK
ncbi:regulator of chromosome condensation [Nematocida major]|uniref:regulator of chromosome condensation n=1 Tax=Nematocida major TaxID=1912982 RepID=UPI0020085D14|nr:regulator of chromosome condensation [Nematocida major]KAH9385375.1 regulator of chromosome condensation [Nematocida major]